MADLNQTCGSTTEEEALSANLSKLQIEQAGAQRVEQTTLLVTLPIELLLQIFEALGPAGRRLLGSTCVKLYETYKAYYYEKKIGINLNEAANPRRPLLAGTRAYQDILSKWICPQSVMDEDAREDDAREMRNQA
ncbi:uncharacterized protein PAC_14377 [Phialocephala subalpina]|uniref:F-box domain-containing protein n=1 Tax=Phialocephala subalpina TaxID=576137 RepID=A0A1L7XHF4_9HELO|nr:uncharacterized protein PAC_14377 [Phialocephala subalpina]